MTGIIYPDFARSIGAAQALRQAETQNAFQLDRMRRADEEDARDRAAGESFGPAIAGDKAAQAKVMANPKYALPLAQFLERADTNQRAKLKETLELTGRTAAGILALPEDQQPAAYEAAYQNLTAQGHRINLPPRWSPALKNQLQGYAVQVPEYLKLLENQPTALGPAPGGAPAPAGTGNAANAISGIESQGNYNAVGPVANSKGNRAYGKYQVMDFNVGPWTTEVLGRAMTPQEFLASQKAQDAVFNAKFGQYVSKYGSPEAASRAWFAGEGGMNNPGASDVNGMTVQGYGQKFAQAYGAGATGAPAGVPVGDTQPRADANGTPLPPASDPLAPVRGIQLPPGARIMAIKGQPIIKEGTVQILRADGQVDFIPLPTRAPPKERQAPAGYDFQPGGGLAPIPGGPADKNRNGPFAGTGMDAQAMNILLAGDPASPEYALAYSHLSKPRTTLDDQGRPVTIQPMDLSAVRKPAALAAAPAAPAGGTTTPLPGGGQVTVGEPVAPKGPSATEMAKLRNARAEAEKITAAANDFKAEWAKASPVDRARALAGANTPLNAAYNNFALLAKGDALFQLGVLNGPDLDIIRRAMPDPSTGKSLMTSEADMISSVDKVLNILSTGISAHEKQLGIAPPAAQQPAPESGGGQRLSPEEAQKLPPGTTFIGTDGVQRVRR